MDNLHSDDSKCMLEAVNLTKRYEDGVLAVDRINFGVRRGEIYAMLGGNGAGKTTTINMFLSLLPPTEGEALVNGTAAHLEPLVTKSQLAFVSENVELYGNFTAIQNLDFFSRLGGHAEYEREDYRRVLLRVGLPEQVHNKRLRGFSKGMRQKCGIAIAILKDAPAIVLDEPTSGLDPKAGFEFVQLLKSLRDENKAILMSTHDIFRAKEIADTIAIMDNGRIVMQEPASAIADKDLEHLYLQYMSGQSAETAA